MISPRWIYESTLPDRRAVDAPRIFTDATDQYR
jgi:hypothetical protein